MSKISVDEIHSLEDDRNTPSYSYTPLPLLFHSSSTPTPKKSHTALSSHGNKVRQGEGSEGEGRKLWHHGRREEKEGRRENIEGAKERVEASK